MTDITIDVLQAENDALRADVRRLNSTVAIVRWKEEKARADQLKDQVFDQLAQLGEAQKQIDILLSKHDAHAKQVLLNLEANASAYRAEKRLHILAERSSLVIEAFAYGKGATAGELVRYATFVKKLLTSDIKVP